jgi:hypothetical protein
VRLIVACVALPDPDFVSARGRKRTETEQRAKITHFFGGYPENADSEEEFFSDNSTHTRSMHCSLALVDAWLHSLVCQVCWRRANASDAAR